MAKAPAFQFYASDWLGDANVKRLDYAAKGVYIDILALMWESRYHYRILDDGDLLKQLNLTRELWSRFRAQFQKPKEEVFDEKSGYLVSRRLRGQWRNLVRLRKIRQNAVLSRWSCKSHAKAMQKACSPIPTPTPLKTTSVSEARKRKTDPLWEALVKAFWEPGTKNERGKFNVACQQLREIGVDPKDIYPRLAAYKRKYPKAAATPNALVSHWGELEAKTRKPNPVMERWRLLDSGEQGWLIREYRKEFNKPPGVPVPNVDVAEWWQKNDVPF